MENFSNAFTDALAHYWITFIALLPKLLTGVIIIIVGMLLSRIVGNIVQQKLLKKAKDPLTARFLTKALRFIFSICVLMLALYAGGLGGIAGGMLAAAGASAVVLGFAFKDIGENFIAGVILAFNRPFNIDDTILVGDIFGKVKTLELRYTKIKTFDGKDVYIPNADVLTKPVTNYTEDGFYRLEFFVGIGYEDDINTAKQLILNVLENHPDLVTDENHENFVVEDELATCTVNLKVLFWADTKDFRKAAMVTRGEVINQVKKLLTEKGFNLPANIQELKLYNTQSEIHISVKNK